MQSWSAPDVPPLPGTGLPLRVHDTATSAVHPTTPGPVATMYVCGITPYDAAHLGHAATYVGFDSLQRVWRDAGHQVRYVQNVTDIDDPLLERADRDGVDWAALAVEQTDVFRADMTALRVLPPDHLVGAVEAIPEIVEMVQKLLADGVAYELDGDVYYSVDAAERFGSVAGFDIDTMLALSAERGGDPEREGKKNPLDARLWMAQRPGEPGWESPLGTGRPGWHIECIAIALNRLGDTLDVNGGGSDLAFPHHELGAAHATSLTGAWPFARSYVHTGMVGLDGEKMSKSKGNLVFVHRLLADGADPAAVRLAILAHHYRADWPWTDDVLRTATARLQAWRSAVGRSSGPEATSVLADVRAAMADDLDTPRALRVVDRWAEQSRLGEGSDDAAPGLVSDLVDALLGIDL